MIKKSSKFHNNPILVPLHKPPYPVMDLYDSQNVDLKIRVDIWMNMNVIPVEY